MEPKPAVFNTRTEIAFACLATPYLVDIVMPEIRVKQNLRWQLSNIMLCASQLHLFCD